MILIIGSPDDAHANHIHRILYERKIPVGYLDTRHFLTGDNIDFYIHPKGSHISYYDPHTDQEIDSRQIKSVYWKCYYESIGSLTQDWNEQIRHREIDSISGSFIRILEEQGCYFVNSRLAYQTHKYKTYQLYKMQQANIPVPHTLVTNSPHSIPSFYQDEQESVIYKPVRGGAHTQELKQEDLEEERLNKIQTSPVKFQQKVVGDSIRAFIFDKDVLGIHIETDHVDYRDDQQAPLTPVDLPSKVKKQCRQIANMFHLEYSGIDIIRDKKGNYTFLEANPAPMFMAFEQRSGQPLTQHLIKLLLKPF